MGSEFMQQMNRQSARSGRSNTNLQANICLQVTGYDLEAEGGARVIGVALSPEWAYGAEFAVRMQTREESEKGFRRDKSPQENAKFFARRPTIEKIANGTKVGNNQVEPVHVGGFLMAYGCMKDGARPESGPAPWKAQYIDNFGNDASRSVEAGVARFSVTPAREEGGKYFREHGRMELLFPRDAEIIKSADDFRNFIDTYMHGERDGARFDGMAAIRVVEELQPKQEGDRPRAQVFSGFVYAARKEVEFEGENGPAKAKLPADAAETFNKIANSKKGVARLVLAAFTGDTQGLDPKDVKSANSLKSDLEAGKLKIEAIPGRVVPMVGTTLEEVMKEGSKMNLAASKCFHKDEQGNVVAGFVKLTTGLMKKPQAEGLPDSVLVTSFATDFGARGMSINSVATPHVLPEWGRTRAAEAEKAAQAAAEQGGQDATPGDEPAGPGGEYAENREHAYETPGM